MRNIIALGREMWTVLRKWWRQYFTLPLKVAGTAWTCWCLSPGPLGRVSLFILPRAAVMQVSWAGHRTWNLLRTWCRHSSLRACATLWRAVWMCSEAVWISLWQRYEFSPDPPLSSSLLNASVWHSCCWLSLLCFPMDRTICHLSHTCGMG